MVLLQPRLNLKVSQKQILTPGLVQMVSVLALNKLELKDMINTEMVENPVLEELDPTVPLLDEVASREEERDRQAQQPEEGAEQPFNKKDDPFEQIDFGSFFQEYLDPGYRTSSEIENVEKPSFENFLSKPSTLTDHLMWQLGASSAKDGVRRAAELVIGNLNEEGYLTASEDELLMQAHSTQPGLTPEPSIAAGIGNPAPHNGATRPATEPLRVDDGEMADRAGLELGLHGYESPAFVHDEPSALDAYDSAHSIAIDDDLLAVDSHVADPQSEDVLSDDAAETTHDIPSSAEHKAPTTAPLINVHVGPDELPLFTREELRQALALVRQFDPVGVACADLRGCLLEQLKAIQQNKFDLDGDDSNDENDRVLADAMEIVDKHLRFVQNKQLKECAKAMGRTIEAVQAALDYIRTLDPKPGLRYNKVAPRLIEPDVALVKQGDEWLVLMNDEDVPQLRLNTSYKKLLNREVAEKDVRTYVKERYKSAIQLIKNIEQRKQTILRVCYAIVGRQRDFLEHGIDQLKPMMIKEVAEEIGVHPSTVSRAVANKYAHTPQGVFELRYFFSESVQGPEGGNTSLLILKRRVKKLIEEEDPSRPLTDEQITRILQSQGIQVTRRTVAKYREDMKIPSTHQRRVKS